MDSRLSVEVTPPQPLYPRLMELHPSLVLGSLPIAGNGIPSRYKNVILTVVNGDEMRTKVDREGENESSRLVVTS
jgi:hypothetical protein